ncbi:type II secretion system protein [Tautonia marina]|uniref:type II secretion system protein n=1 Tax=Tautonia marina TaxID=2653855 RepID=UPI00191BCE22|nr:type II secretion system protein [Tautonia marina]
MRSRSSPRRRAGFTLVELGVVILIIGIMMSFLLVASFEGLKRANERATQSLIQKLDLAVSDRIEALTGQRPEPNNGHRFMAMSIAPDPVSGTVRYVDSEARARLIAQIDYLKRELPDVFFVQPDQLYPLNFTGVPFKPSSMAPGPGAGSAFPQIPAAYAPYVLPLGHALQIDQVWDGDTKLFGAGLTRLGDMSGLDPSQVRFTSPPAGQGIFGASYSAIGSLTRQLGYPPRGYNGIDDDGNGLIDEFTIDELYRPGDPDRAASFSALQTDLTTRLGNHRHLTARSEMLYAILVSGVGPLGSVFSADDFTPQEVQDTDGDGLPEFVDAWGQPLQFYRWPVYFVSEYGATTRGLQKGEAPYTAGDLREIREENPLDPNQLLVSPGWWADPTTGYPDNAAQMSARANVFQQQFFSLLDPYADLPAGSVSQPFPSRGFLWDRTHFYKRRSYFFKHLILSAGPDRQLGVGSFGVTYSGSVQDPASLPAGDAATTAARMTLIENQASRSDPYQRIPGQAGPADLSNAANLTQKMALYQLPADASPFTVPLRDRWGVDDLTNHSPNTLGTGGR